MGVFVKKVFNYIQIIEIMIFITLSNLFYFKPIMSRLCCQISVTFMQYKQFLLMISNLNKLRDVASQRKNEAGDYRAKKCAIIARLKTFLYFLKQNLFQPFKNFTKMLFPVILFLS